MNAIGIMQGRLSPPVGGRIQSFPAETWREEFSRAREAGLAGLEWVYEAETESANPLRSARGAEQVRALAEREGTSVLSVCADFYMVEQLTDESGRPDEAVIEHLRALLARVRAVGGTHVVLPFVDASSLRTAARVDGTIAALSQVSSDADRYGVELHLETDLLPETVAEMLETLDHPSFRANYDIGNSAALGRDPDQELSILGPWLGSVHIKDRALDGRTVPLGTGAVKFEKCLRRIQEAGYERPFVLQAARQPEISEVELARRNRTFLENVWSVSAAEA